MTWFPYRRQAAWDTSGAPRNEGVGAIYDVEDVTFSTPLVARAMGVPPGSGTGAVLATVAIADFLSVEFEAEAEEVYWKSGDAPPVHLMSAVGMRDATRAAAAAAQESRVAAETAAALVDAPADGVTATLVGNLGTQTRTALDGLYAGGTSAAVFSGPVALSHAALPLPGSPRAGNVTVGTGYVTLAASGVESNAFPAVALCADGTLLAAWRAGPGHGVNLAANLVTARSSDLGATWSTPAEPFADASYDQRDPWLIRMGSGVLALTYFKSDTGGVAESVVRFSTDHGATWSTETLLPFTFTGTLGAVTSITETDTGDLLVTGYGKDTAATYTSTQVLRSTDGGASWGSPVTIADGPTAGRPYNEACVDTLPSGDLMALVRSDDGSGGGTGAGIYRTTSTDDGATWSAPALVLAGYGRPGWVALTSGGVVASYRKVGGQREHLVVTSWDQGVTWSSPTLLHPSTVTQQSVYSQPVEISPGLIGVIYCDEITVTDAMTRFRYLMDGTGVTPLGDSRLSPARRFVSADTLRVAGANPAATAGTISNQRIWSFDASTTQHIAGYVEVPQDWATFDIAAVWAPSSTHTGDARLDCSYFWVEVGATASSSGTFVNAGTHAAGGVVNVVQRDALASGLPVVPGAPLMVRIIRNAAEAGDTFTGNVQLLGIELVRAS